MGSAVLFGTIASGVGLAVLTARVSLAALGNALPQKAKKVA